MRHRKKTVKLGRKTAHRESMLANMTCSLIRHSRIKTTLPKAKALRPYAEKLVTLGKKGTLADRRIALSRLDGKVDEVHKLFTEIAPRFKDRQGGYTRILKIGPRNSDASYMAYIEWVEGSSASASEKTASDQESEVQEQPPTQVKAKPKAAAKAAGKTKK